MSSIPNSNAIPPEIQAMISVALAAQAQMWKPQLNGCHYINSTIKISDLENHHL
ncbi:hypothetical protein CROQUDRAFT_87141 [Cronartium quercuum f. sp. fusiforme G11]|uniref:Uncharacterized protein n=1 Tax=Cronartium quercuum f. sp. fusiforme G11 TaxID=708437 RepID=A0A9P6NPN8_9BASI|nr:hypothetical protein CROQUDRAFT_87141 [Cronartium quercuum f. sp. fusiforme G11]